MNLPTVAIVGRPNVGKSTIFNRLIGQRLSIIEDCPGVTRDRVYGRSDWNGRQYTLIDTGGLDLADKSQLIANIRLQVELAITEADVILFFVDGKAGLLAMDEEIAGLLRRSNKEIILVVNKIDNIKQQADAYQFYNLGFTHVYAISSAHGTGTGDMLDALVDLLPEQSGPEYDEETIKVAIIGRPNVGKSSLTNALLGEDRVIVSDVAGTTRDAIDTELSVGEQKYVLIDTAGIRRRGKVYEKIEKYSVLRAMRAIERSDVCMIVIDGETGIVEQDKKIAGYAHEAGRASVFVVNKWDIVTKDERTASRFEKDLLEQQFKFMDYAPVIFVSAKTKQRIHRILPLVCEVDEQHAQRISTGTLNRVLLEAVTFRPAPSHRGKRLRVGYATQVSVRPPTFVLFVNDPELMHFSYQRYLENQLRQAFHFRGTPINIILRKKNKEQ